MISITISSQVPPTEMKTLRIFRPQSGGRVGVVDQHADVTDSLRVHDCSSASRVACMRRMPASQRSRSLFLGDLVGQDQEALLFDRPGDHLGHLLRLLDRSRDLARERGTDVAEHRRADTERGQQRRANALVVVGDRHPLGETYDRVLGCRVGQLAVARQDAGHRGGMDQVAAAAFQHAGQDRADGVDMGHHVDVPLLLPDFEIGRQRIRAGRDAGVAEEDVDRSEARLDVPDETVDLRLPAHVARDGHAADLVGDPLRFVSIQVRDRDPGSAGGEAPGTRRPDAAGAAGDDGGLPVELHQWPRSSSFATWLRWTSSGPSPKRSARFRA
jgi:hypothetical protein